MHCYARHPGAACPAFHRISSRSYESIEPLFGLPARSGSTFCRKTNGQPGMALVDADSTTGSSLARPSAPPAEPAIHNKAKHETIRVSPAVLGGPVSRAAPPRQWWSRRESIRILAGFQYTPVLSMATCVTPSCMSQLAMAPKSSVIAPHRRTIFRDLPPPS